MDMTEEQLKILKAVNEEYRVLDKKDARGLVDFLRTHQVWVSSLTNMSRYLRSPMEVLIDNCCIDEGITLFRQFLQHLNKDDKDIFAVMVHVLKVRHAHDFHHCVEKIAKMILVDMKNTLPDNLRSAFWNEMLDFKFNRHYCLRDDTLYLIDNESMRKIMCQEKHQEYESIPKGLLFEHKQAVPVCKNIQDVLPKDDFATFEITSALSGQKLTVGTLQAILASGAASILCHLMRHRPNEISRLLSPFDLLCCICARKTTNAEFDVAVLNTLEELHPGISKLSDHLGNTPLWYCLYHPCEKEPLINALQEFGCNPEQRNNLNLSYSLCHEAFLHPVVQTHVFL